MVNDKELILPTGEKIVFNEEQYLAILKIRAWLKNSKNFFTLAGYAGTGKTTILKKIIEDYKRNVVISAPTHTAKKVAMRATGLDGVTLHSILGLRPDVDLDDYNPNDPKFNPIAKPTINNYRFIIIDEASMINEELFDLLKSTIKNNNWIKILFVGDPAQIPPIGEKLSAVFFDKSIELYELTQVMRQNESNPLFNIFDTLRNNLNIIDGNIVRKTNINKKGEGVLFTNNHSIFRNKINEIYSSEVYNNNIDYVKLIGWRNITINKSNKIIREMKFNKPKHILEVGEILTAYRSIRSRKQYYNIIDNSDNYRVMRISAKTQNKFGLEGYYVTLRETVRTGEYFFKDVFILDHDNYDNLHNYAEMHDILKQMAKMNKEKWKDYYDLRRETLIMLTITNYRNGNARDFSEVIKKDIDYGYAITAHKSQGATYTHVFILEDDIDVNPLIQERNQIKYVAFTRPVISANVFNSRLINNIKNF